MQPTLAPGDRLLVRYGARVRAGRVVVARFADGVVVVKRAAHRERRHDGREGWFLLSDHLEAPGVVDSRARGPVADEDVLAVAVVRLWPRPRRL